MKKIHIVGTILLLVIFIIIVIAAKSESKWEYGYLRLDSYGTRYEWHTSTTHYLDKDSNLNNQEHYKKLAVMMDEALSQSIPDEKWGSQTSESGIILTFLNYLGNQGWELIIYEGEHEEYYFKRKK